MAEFRKITEVEEISGLTGDENILLNDHGCLKQINKKNAKLGGGVTIFTAIAGAQPQAVTDSPVAVQSDSGVSTQEATATFFRKEDGTEATPQEIYDAFMSGSAILKQSGDLDMYAKILSVVPCTVSGDFCDGTNVGYIHYLACFGSKITLDTYYGSNVPPKS